MPRKPAPKPDDPAQYKRFLDAARELETDDSPEGFERIFDQVSKAADPDKDAPAPPEKP